MDKNNVYRNDLVKSVYGFPVTTLTLGSVISTMMNVSYAYIIYLSDINKLKEGCDIFLWQRFYM